MPLPQKLTVHVGLHKTGTTFIQSVIERNRKAFEALGDTIIRQDNQTKELTDSCRALHAAMSENKPTGAHAEMIGNGFLNLVLRSGRQDRPMLISDELLSGRMTGLGKDWALFPALPTICDIFQNAVPELEITFALYLRDFGRWIESAHNQAVKVNRMRLDLDEFRARIGGASAVDDLLTRTRAVVGDERFMVVEMEDELKPGNVLGSALYRTLGMTAEQIQALSPGERSNPSLTPDALALMLRINRSKLTTPELRKFRRILHAEPAMYRSR